MSKISVSSPAAGTATYTISAPTGSTDRTLSLPDQTATLITNSADVLNIGSGQFYKDASGNVGIGTSSPSTKLHVTGSIRSGVDGSDSLTAGANVQLVNAAGSRGSILQLNAANGLAFWSNGAGSWTQTMTLDSSGNLLVSKTADTNSVAGTVIALVDAGGAGKHGKIKVTNTVGTGQYILEGLNASGGTVGGVTTTSTTTSFPTSSDYRLKENIAPMTDALSVVQQLKPCTYTWKSNGESTQGFIAHELQEVVPECVVGEKDAVDAEGKPVYQGIDTSFLVATLTAAIQELKAIVDAQGAEIAALKGTA